MNFIFNIEEAYCDFAVREVGNPKISHVYTVQCVLPVNLFNQQIFIVIWFWYSMIFFFNIAGLVKWIVRSIPNKSSDWIRKRVQLNDEIKLTDSKLFDHFTDIYLEADGIFMIRMIGNNTNEFVATDLIHELWKLHQIKYTGWANQRRKSVIKTGANVTGCCLMSSTNTVIEPEQQGLV
jgi:hypothetical protein